MNKTWLIIRREYLYRVLKRSFIITTLLVPILFVGLIVGVAAIAMNATTTKHVAVVDESGHFKGLLKNENHIEYSFPSENLAQLRNDEKYDAVLHIPAFDESKKSDFSLYSQESIGLEAQMSLQSQMNDIIYKERLKSMGVNVVTLDSLQQENISITNIDKEGKSKSTELAYAIGYGSGFLLYMFMLLYGMNVMRSVMEEKTNRIAEIMVSSVKPFQLMMGKIIGVALVGLTQFLIWITVSGVLSSVGLGMVGSSLMSNPDVMTQAAQGGPEVAAMSNPLQFILGNADWVSIIGWFLFYFLGGYFLYAALFAAIGSLVNEDPQDAQQLTLPVTMPIIVAFIAMTVALREPHGTLAIVCSIFPLTSPVVMMARIPFGVPAWQLIASAIALILGFWATTWMAAKIYRTGILLYGKKITLKEVGKWLVRK